MTKTQESTKIREYRRRRNGNKKEQEGSRTLPPTLFSLPNSQDTVHREESAVLWWCWCFFTEVLVNSSSEVALACYRFQDGGEESFNKKDGVKRNAKNARGLTLTLTLTSLPVFRRHRPISQVASVLFSLCSFEYVPTILSESLAQATVALNNNNKKKQI